MKSLNATIAPDRAACGRAAATYGAERLRAVLRAQGFARIIVATGASQFEMLEALVAEPGIDWTRVTAFHLDEYVGIPITHPASFRQYLWKRFVSQLPLPLAAFHYLNGEGDADAECRRVGKLLKALPIDIAFVGIGENGHLAFNDPPADFKTAKPYLVVDLDEACRRQQLGEGWFKTMRQVPRQAISMSIRQIMAARAIVCTVPDTRKAQAVKDCLAGDVTPLHPASILQWHTDTRFFLDKPAAALLGVTMDTSGWIDLQVNGFLGVDFSSPELTLDGVRRVTAELRKRGTSAYCPTLITCNPATYARNLPILAEAMRAPELREHLPGLHMEGPFLATPSRGAHPAAWLALPDPRRFDEWQKLADGGIRILTLAPELEGAPALTRHAVRQGVVVSLGHHLADDDAIARAIDAGATLCTHIGNGIVNTLPRHPNPIWTQLASDALTACVIADGHHLPAPFLRVAWRAKGRDRFVVTSDAAAIAGLPPGDYGYMGSAVTIEASGRIVVRHTDTAGTTLAGSSSTMADCLRHLASLGGWTDADLDQVGRCNPARVLGTSLETRGSGTV